MASAWRLALALAWMSTVPARAADLGSPPTVEAHGFVSQGFIKSTGSNFLADSKRGSFEFTEVAINFTSQLTDRLRLGIQLFARDLGPVGNYSAKADWFYLDYRWRDWFGIRAGRIKLPFGLYNDTSDIDSARVPILLPQSVYSLSSRDFLLAQTGGELYGYLNLPTGGALEYRLYSGTIHIDVPNQTGVAFPITQIKNPYLVGARLFWETPLEGLRLGGSGQMLRLDINALSPLTMPPSPLVYQVSAVLWLASVEYALHDLLIAGEFGLRHLRNRVSNPALLPAGTVPPPEALSLTGYVMTHYRLTPWLQPGLYYSAYYPDVDHRTRGRADMQHDVAATLRFDVNQYWLVKLEGHYMHGTAGVQAALNSPVPLGGLAENWAVFLVKTTAYF